MPEEDRTRETRARAESALVRLIHMFDDNDVFLVVLGGLVPETLARQDREVPAHLGTTDVDVLLISHVEPLLDMTRLESVLYELDFKPDPKEDGWRWRGPIDGVPVKLEFLCDLSDVREHESVRPEGCSRLSAKNLRGTGYVAKDFEWKTLNGTLADGTEVTVKARFAGLGGYLLSKCTAARTRAADKDFYDFVYVLEQNQAGGPGAAAGALLDGPHASDLSGLSNLFTEVRGRFEGPNDVGPVGYANQALQVEPGSDAMTLRLDAVDVVQRFFDALEISVG